MTDVTRTLHMPCGCPYPAIGDHTPCVHGNTGAADVPQAATDAAYEAIPGCDIRPGGWCATHQRHFSQACDPRPVPALSRAAESPWSAMWDWRAQPPMDAIAAAVTRLSGGRVRVYLPETGMDSYVIVLADRDLSEAEIEEAWAGE